MIHHPSLFIISVVLALGAFVFGCQAVRVTPALIDEKPTANQLSNDQTGALFERVYWVLISLAVITFVLSLLS